MLDINLMELKVKKNDTFWKIKIEKNIVAISSRNEMSSVQTGRDRKETELCEHSVEKMGYMNRYQ